jgi:hypothetical protein
VGERDADYVHLVIDKEADGVALSGVPRELIIFKAKTHL